MKNLKYIFLLLAVGTLFSSCYKEESFVDKNVKEGGTFYPVIQILSVTNVPDDGTFAVGDNVDISLTYFSIDDVKNIEVYNTINGTETLANTYDYVYSYDADAAAEVQVLKYTVPADAAGQEVSLRVVVNTTQGLLREKTTSIVVE